MSKWQWCQLIGFQAYWMIAVLGQNPMTWLCLALLGLHFSFSPSPKRDLWILPLALPGIIVDGLLTRLGFFQFDDFPFWLGLLWVGFVLTIGHSQRWMYRVPAALLPVLGAIAGCAAYLGAWRLGAVEFLYGPLTVALVIALAWAVLLPSMVMFDKRLRGPYD